MSGFYSHPLFRLLDAGLSFPSTAHHESTTRRAFSPNFDVRETEKEYILDGELPGLSNKSNVNVEFTDGQTLLVKGHIERSYKSSSEDHKTIESSDNQSIIETVEPSSPKSLKPTVEDEVDETDKPTSPEVSKKSEGKPAVNKKTNKGKDTGLKYWLSERTVGEFQRRFTFPDRIDQDAVTASLEHGVLTIVVPKNKHPIGRRIDIQ